MTSLSIKDESFEEIVLLAESRTHMSHCSMFTEFKSESDNGDPLKILILGKFSSVFHSFLR